VDRLGFTPADLDAVIREYDQVLDVNRDDLEALFLQTEMHAYRRRFGEIRCGDIMSRDIVSLEFSTPLDEAWALLHERHVGAIPVIDRGRRVIGIISQADFVRYANVDAHPSLDARLRTLIRRTLHSHSEKPEVVGQIMSTSVQTARDDMHIVELVPLMSDSYPHHLPIIDSNCRLVGMVTLSDLVAALYRGRLIDTSS
jgi:CBS domain-containing membrane protein